MNEAISSMLKRYRTASVEDYENAIIEIIQEIALLGLWRSKFFEHAAFYGGSALRILYGLDRFSEDLDFSLIKPNHSFNLSAYTRAIQSELEAFGFSVQVEAHEKNSESVIESAFIKAGTIQSMLSIQAPDVLIKRTHKNKLLKIKLEVDINPPSGFKTESKIHLMPIPFGILTYTQPDLFAGKVHALLCRQWKNRVKGRDWYDLVWFIGRSIEVNLAHLKRRLVQSGHWDDNKLLDRSSLIQLFNERISKIDFNQAKSDVERFLRDPSSISLWSAPFFQEVISSIKCVD